MIKSAKYGLLILAIVLFEAILLYKGDLQCGKFLGYLGLNIALFFYILVNSIIYIKKVFLKDLYNYKKIFITFVYVACLSLSEWIIYLLSVEVFYCLK